VLVSGFIFSQETMPVSSDYLSDNVYMLHPASAGIGNAGKIRATSATQWKGVANAPGVKTLSFHNRYGTKMGLGFAIYNNENGNNAQIGLQGTYAYHLNLSNRGNQFEQLSFALSLNLVQNRFDTSIFADIDLLDPVVANIKASDTYYNGDFGMAYHKERFFSYLTIKNLFLTTKTAGQLEALNLRKFLFNAGYFWGNERLLQYEPSILVLHDPYFEVTTFDVNMKIYKNIERSKLWFALSFRQSFGGQNSENWNYLSPIAGVNYRNFIFAYSYKEQLGNLSIAPKGGFHQLTLGWDVFVKKSRLAACPNINTAVYY
jgi:type IX secretion system PorP/SprF family membrane protein